MITYMPLIIFGLGIIATLQGWILIQLYSINGKLSSFDSRIGHLEGVVHSERETMKRRHDDYDKKFDSLFEKVHHLEAHVEHK